MAYAMRFNIANKLDIETLNRRINACCSEFHDDLYIFMSPDTIIDMPQLDAFYTGKSTCNNCTGKIGLYQGHKVFCDPTMKYGDVEFR